MHHLLRFASRAALALFAVLSAAASSSAADLPGPTATDLLAKVDAVMGGDSVKTEMMTVSTTIDGKYATVTFMLKRPDRILERIRVPQDNAQLTIGIIGSVAWIQTPDGQVRGADLGDQNVGMKIVSTEYSTAGLKNVSRKPDRDYLGVTYYVLHVTPASGRSYDMLIDKTTYEPAASQIVYKGATFTQAFSEYTRGPGGEYYPRHIRYVAPDGTTIKEDTVLSVDDDVPLDDAMFAPPTS